MSYRISYGKIQQETPRKPHRLRYCVAAVVLALVIMARILFPAETMQIAEAMFPLTGESAQEALEVFVQNIGAGESLGDAVTAFCQEILDDAREP